MEMSPEIVDLSCVDWDIEENPTFVVKSMADMLYTYLRHPESGMVDRNGNYSKGSTTGLLYYLDGGRGGEIHRERNQHA